ncbi:MAG TPA: DUF1684 domain-containing protein [Bryobacteraceae bacterium]|nr:DUF1684 domain-containing protein [Bryobacteraceae bacterium]
MTWMRLATGLLPALALFAASAFEDEIAQWRRDRENSLKAEGGWLSLAGLFWLHEGANSFGKDASCEIVLPDGPARGGTFELSGDKVRVTVDGSTRDAKPDSADVVRIGRVSLFVIKRGDRYGIRLKDPESEARRNFHGIESYPANESYRVTARFVAEPEQISIVNIIGQTEHYPSPGYAVFKLQGQELRLRPYLEGPNATQLFYVFRDQTSGKETYGAGRFLYSVRPHDGQVTLDFNKAYNPPCSFTPYATCPLPPPENRLAVRIEAGEKKYGH